MAKFVWFESYTEGRVPVNPDQVAYVRKGVRGETQLVFGAIQGGFHMLQVAGPVDEAVDALEGGQEKAAAPVRRPPVKPAKRKA